MKMIIGLFLILFILASCSSTIPEYIQYSRDLKTGECFILQDDMLIEISCDKLPK
jgi:hypothetical protein